jgi:PKD repeat protein
MQGVIALSSSDLTPAAVDEITRTVAETTVGPGESTTVTVTVDLTEQLQLEPGDLVEIEDSFSPGFEAVTHQDGLPEPGGAGGSADGEEYLAVWNEGAASYTVTYEVSVPFDVAGDEQFDITGTVDLAGQEEPLPDETIDVGIPEETGVALVASDSTVPGEEMVPLDLAVTGADTGIGSYSVDLATDDTAAVAFADIELTNPADTDNSQITNGGASALVDAELSQDHPAEPATVIAELTLDTGTEGEATLSVDSASVADQNGDGYQIASQTGVTLTVQTGPPPLPGFDSEPQDLDGDGLYRDVDGDGEFDIFDVQAFFNTFETAEVQNNADAFDFDGDGDVDILDVQRLFEDLQNS